MRRFVRYIGTLPLNKKRLSDTEIDFIFIITYKVSKFITKHTMFVTFEILTFLAVWVRIDTNSSFRSPSTILTRSVTCLSLFNFSSFLVRFFGTLPFLYSFATQSLFVLSAPWSTFCVHSLILINPSNLSSFPIYEPKTYWEGRKYRNGTTNETHWKNPGRVRYVLFVVLCDTVQDGLSTWREMGTRKSL